MIFAKVLRNYWEFRENQRFYFRDIKNNFVKISCFAKFLKCCFAATLVLIVIGKSYFRKIFLFTEIFRDLELSF